MSSTSSLFVQHQYDFTPTEQRKQPDCSQCQQKHEHVVIVSIFDTVSVTVQWQNALTCDGSEFFVGRSKRFMDWLNQHKPYVHQDFQAQYLQLHDTLRSLEIFNNKH